jgi:Fe-S oxidoreductase
VPRVSAAEPLPADIEYLYRVGCAGALEDRPCQVTVASAELLRTAAGRTLKIIATCPHCFNTLADEYPQLGGTTEVIHHTQLLARLNSTEEALDPDLISTACPLCMVMLSDAVNAKKADGTARDDVTVQDVAQILNNPSPRQSHLAEQREIQP